jgi:DNA-damage-inducible protein J
MSTSSRSPDACRPFEVKVANAATRRAMAELEQGRGKRFDSADPLFEDLDI